MISNTNTPRILQYMYANISPSSLKCVLMNPHHHTNIQTLFRIYHDNSTQIAIFIYTTNSKQNYIYHNNIISLILNIIYTITSIFTIITNKRTKEKKKKGCGQISISIIQISSYTSYKKGGKDSVTCGS